MSSENVININDGCLPARAADAFTGDTVQHLMNNPLIVRLVSVAREMQEPLVISLHVMEQDLLFFARRIKNDDIIIPHSATIHTDRLPKAYALFWARTFDEKLVPLRAHLFSGGEDPVLFAQFPIQLFREELLKFTSFNTTDGTIDGLVHFD